MTDPEAIFHWRRLDDRITISGQPNEEQLAEFRCAGCEARGQPQGCIPTRRHSSTKLRASDGSAWNTSTFRCRFPKPN